MRKKFETYNSNLYFKITVPLENNFVLKWTRNMTKTINSTKFCAWSLLKTMRKKFRTCKQRVFFLLKYNLFPPNSDQICLK